MKKLIFMGCMLIGSIVKAGGFDASTLEWKNSPLNYDNSKLNYENSELKWENSPLNYDNSTLNSKRKAVYDEDGESLGYKVYKKNGGANIFSNDGKRIGYETPQDDDK